MISFNPYNKAKGRQFHCSHFINEKTEAQGGQISSLHLLFEMQTLETPMEALSFRTAMSAGHRSIR